MWILEVAAVLALFALNGFFAMAEFAIVASRRPHLERLAKERQMGAREALALADDPARMLAAVQIGFTTSAMLAGIFSGATLAERLEEILFFAPGVMTYAKPVSIAIVTIAVTYTALIIGELVPKHIALSSPETIAARVARPLALVATAAAPLITLLNASTRLFLRLLRLRPPMKPSLTEDDIHYLVAEGARVGVIGAIERDMIEGVLDLADSPVSAIMTPRARVQWVDLHTDNAQILRKVRTCRQAQLLVCRGSIDEVSGIVRKQDLIDQVLDGRPPDVAQATRAPLIVPETTTVLRTIELFRKTPVHAAVVVDGLRKVKGIVTRTDLLETVAGDLPKIG
jgi:putative hemolysin